MTVNDAVDSIFVPVINEGALDLTLIKSGDLIQAELCSGTAIPLDVVSAATLCEPAVVRIAKAFVIADGPASERIEVTILGTVTDPDGDPNDWLMYVNDEQLFPGEHILLFWKDAVGGHLVLLDSPIATLTYS